MFLVKIFGKNLFLDAQCISKKKNSGGWGYFGGGKWGVVVIKLNIIKMRKPNKNKF